MEFKLAWVGKLGKIILGTSFWVELAKLRIWDRDSMRRPFRKESRYYCFDCSNKMVSQCDMHWINCMLGLDANFYKCFNYGCRVNIVPRCRIRYRGYRPGYVTLFCQFLKSSVRSGTIGIVVGLKWHSIDQTVNSYSWAFQSCPLTSRLDRRVTNFGAFCGASNDFVDVCV